VSPFPSSAVATEVFQRLFSTLLQDDQFVADMRASGITLLFEHRAPACRVFVSAEEVLTGPEAPEHATLTMKISSAAAHSLWLDEITFPAAITNGRLEIIAKVSKVLEVMPILAPAFVRYPAIARDAGLLDQPAADAAKL
jgi:hypothetical protein